MTSMDDFVASQVKLLDEVDRHIMAAAIRWHKDNCNESDDNSCEPLFMRIFLGKLEQGLAASDFAKNTYRRAFAGLEGPQHLFKLNEEFFKSREEPDEGTGLYL